jgi:mevalonate kinase
MNRAHSLLADLGVATAQLDGLCNAARLAGALGAKLTGAGGGGSVIAIAPRHRESAVLAAWKQLGTDGFVATLR